VGTAAVGRPPHRPNVEAGPRETEKNAKIPVAVHSGINKQLPSIIKHRDGRAFVTG